MPTENDLEFPQIYFDGLIGGLAFDGEVVWMIKKCALFT